MTSFAPEPTADSSDADLVGACLSGNRSAFAHIVARYQALVASIAYSATGSVAQSEDVAQEAFLAAWQHLPRLSEAGKLRAWLCGIPRRLTANATRRGSREPVHFAETLEAAGNVHAPDVLPADWAMSREEEAILWRSLERLPAEYREALVLYYRKGQATEQVAAELGLNEAAVRQRLSRGRRLLEARVAAFVEAALRRSTPGTEFPGQVMAVLPIHFGAAGLAAAAVGSAAKAGAAKSAWSLASLTPLISFLPGAASLYLGYRTESAEASSSSALRQVRRFYLLTVLTIAVPVVLILLAIALRTHAAAHPQLFRLLVLTSSWSWLPAVAGLLALIWRRSAEVSAGVGPSLEHRSTTEFLGAPLVHVRFGGSTAGQPVHAWIAAGDVAVGRLFALGGVAVAPVCVGGFGAGLAVFGGFGAGALVYAGFGLGVWALGGFVTGWLAAGGCAIAGQAALGGICLAGEHALGGVALAPHANEAVARAYLEGSTFFRFAYPLLTKWLWTTMVAATLPTLALHLGSRRRSRSPGSAAS